MAKRRTPANRIKDFTSIADYKASTAKEGDFDAPNFDGTPIRRQVHLGEPHYSVVDIVMALAGTTNPNRYWTDLKRKLRDVEGFPEVYDKIVTLKLPTAGGPQPTDCANIEILLRIIQSIPSPKAEPFKQWLAKVGYERIQETAEPSTAIERAIANYRKMGRDEQWISDRIKAIAGNNEKTDQWKHRGVAGKLYATLNVEMSELAFGVTPARHGEIKQLPPGENRQNHMTRTELAINNLADTAATDIMIARDTKVYADTRRASLDGAGVAKVAREALEKQTGKPVVSAENFLPKIVPTAKQPIEQTKKASESQPMAKRSKQQASTATMQKWFYANHMPAISCSPILDGDYTYPVVEVADVLETQFPDVEMKLILSLAGALEAQDVWCANSFVESMRKQSD